MSFRVISFSIPSTTQLKLTFSDTITESISIDNFAISSLNGSVDDLEVIKITIENDVIFLKTRPQVAGNYYLLKLLDTSEISFSSNKGVSVPFDSFSRELFFVGIDDVNPIRDRMFESVTSLFEIENSIIKNIITAQANEIYTAQKTIGEVLSNNYLSVEITDEIRTRTAGATDRLANENAYEITRVSREPTNSLPKFEKITYTNNSLFERHQSLPYHPISLQEKIVTDEIINAETESNSFNGFLITLKKKNVIKILSVKHILSEELEDCNGEIGTFYQIERFKYAIKDNYYDQEYAFKFAELEDNQILLSEFGNLTFPGRNDTFIVSYIYKDKGRNILEDQVEVSRVEEIINESIPSNVSNFFLKNAPIVNIDNEIYKLGGVSFAKTENLDEVPDEFKKEVVFNSSKLPSKLGEYSINYQTGEVFLVGKNKIGEGTGYNNYVASYYYRKEFIRDLDYSIYNQDLVPSPNRELSNKEAEIFIRYESIFSEGNDYLAKSHIEVMPEFVENRISQSFGIKTKNSPITDVFKILNQTTGEVYNFLYHSENEIFFSGNKSPRIKDVNSEEINFIKIDNEKLNIVGEFILPTFRTIITRNASNNSITFHPGIPSELISINSTDYFIRETDSTESSSDINIRFFGEADSNNLITTLSISSTASPPPLNSEVFIGTKAFVINLGKSGILNKNLDGLGNLTNTSVEFSDLNIFSNQKYFETIQTNPGLSSISGGISQAFLEDKGSIFEENLSRLRIVGDYCIDHLHGIIYVAIEKEQDFEIGNVNYFYNEAKANNKNIISASNVSKKANAPDLLNEAEIIYQNISFSNETITINDIEDSLTIYDGETYASNLDNERYLICEMLEDYTVVVPYNINKIEGIYILNDITGSDLSSSNPDNRIKEYTVDELKISSQDGGRNLYDVNAVSFEKNVIDFKKKKKKRLTANNTISIVDGHAETFIQAKLISSDQIIFDQNLNITKLSGLEIAATSASGSDIVASIASGVDLSEIDIESDYLLDKSGNRFVITDIDTILSTITVSSPAENNSTANEPEIDSDGLTSIVVKPSVNISNGDINITIPEDSGLTTGDLIEITYLTNLIPEIGTELAIDYRCGFIFADYYYIADDLVVWYEYGDNALDWSISDSLSEGDEYYVTYKYGALRSALKTNFGSLTNIPFFKAFGISTDRELYRDAIKGTLQTFPKGPTVSAYKELIKSFTKIQPKIDELAFGDWVVGRDYLEPGNIEYSGVLKFGEGKFQDGLIFNDDVTVSIPAISSISIDEGTVEAWVRPEWFGINNDATLTFNFDHIGIEKVILREKSDPFKTKWDLIPSDSLVGSLDSSGQGFQIYNYKSDQSSEHGLELGIYGIYYNQENLNNTIKSNFQAKMKIGLIGSHFNDLRKEISEDPTIFSLCENETESETYFTVGIHGPGSIVEGPWPISLSYPAKSYISGSLIIADGERVAGLSLNLNEVENFIFEVDPLVRSGGISEITNAEIPKYNRPHYLRNCTCTVENTVSELLDFNNLKIIIELESEFNFEEFLNSNYIIENSPQVFILVDMEGIFYQVLGFYDENDLLNTETIPEVATKFAVKKFGINNPSLSAQGSEAINSQTPSGILRLLYKSADILTKTDYSNSSQIFDFKKKYVLDWQEYHNYKVERIPAENIINIKIDETNIRMFYTDSFYACNLSFDINQSSSNIKGILLGIMGRNLLTELSVLNANGELSNRYSLNDIYIGKEGRNPSKLPFKLNRSDYPLTSVGEPLQTIDKDGIFIWFDELCRSPLSEDIGQWILQARSKRGNFYPIGVSINGSEYTNILEQYSQTHQFKGYIDTDGEFSSVVRSHREEFSNGCENGIICQSNYRFCGNELLEETGWVKIEESDSDLVNSIVSGMETQHVKWKKYGEFTTSNSYGIYRINNVSTSANCIEEDNFKGNYLYIENPCSGGDYDYLISAKIVQSDIEIINRENGSFDGLISGSFTGINIIFIKEDNIYIKLALAYSQSGQPLIAIVNGLNNNIIDIFAISWNDASFHEYRVQKNIDNSILNIYFDNLLISQINLLNIENEELEANEKPALGIYLFDAELVDTEDYDLESNIIDIDLISFSGIETTGDSVLESNDILLHTDSRIEFEFNLDNLDGYLDGYDGYDGYSELTSIDELFIVSDKLRYLLDTGISESKNRFSIYKDGKGFLNFRIHDNGIEKNKEVGIYNLSSNIKNWKAGELHHIAASWKLNTIEEQDEIHLFLDGLEVPNIFKFGGKVPVQINSKFRDVNKEILYDFMVDDIEFCLKYTDGTISAGNSIFQSSQASFSQDMIGRSLIITNSTEAPTLIGGEYLIKSVIDSHQVTLGTGNEMDLITFNSSANDLEFQFPPTAGIKNNVLTDLRNSKVSIFRKKSDETEEEMSGIFYVITDGQIEIIKGDNALNPKFRANLDNRIIEFVGKNDDCLYLSSIDPMDISIDIRTYGLNLEIFKTKLNLASSSYVGEENVFSGNSVIRTTGTEPSDLSDVKIKRILLDKTVININDPLIIPELGYKIEFEIELDNEKLFHNLTSASGLVYKQNLGRLITLFFDSDNVNFCNYDGYGDGYLEDYPNVITVYGVTTDGINQESFTITKNGSFNSDKFFTSLERISGNIIVVDPDYFEAGLIYLEETNDIGVSDNGGSYAEIFEYKNGSLILTTAGSNGTFPFELHPGYYNLEYPTPLKINLPEIGDKIYIGSDINKKNQFGGIIDEFRIISELSSDTRTTELTTAGTRSITNDYYKSNPFCADTQTLTLIHFDNPILYQNRKLRTTSFLDSNSNTKYFLNPNQQEDLLSVVNDERSFVYKMINYGFSLEEAKKTFIEVHKAERGPLFNDAEFYRNVKEFPKSDSSVNENFSKSGNFTNGKGILLYNNDGKFRKDEGTIEFWVSPILDTFVDRDLRYYVDIYSAKREMIKSTTSTLINLNTQAKEILSIKLLQKTQEFSEYFENSETEILFDEISRNNITGKLFGGTGTDKDFGIGAKLSADGNKIYLAESLPGQNIDVMVTYIPISSQGDRFSIFKNQYNQIVFSITANGIDNIVSVDINWKKNSWHRIKCLYKTGTLNDSMRIFVDGTEGGYITYGTGILYGEGYVYGQFIQGEGQYRNNEFNIPIGDEFKLISIGSDVFGDYNSKSRMDNIRFSKILRGVLRDSSGQSIDLDYSENLNTIYPVISDDATTLLLDFDEDKGKIDKFATIIDPNSGIYNFDITVYDDFDKVINKNNGEIEDLIIDLVNRLKPAHTNSIVRFKKNKC